MVLPNLACDDVQRGAVYSALPISYACFMARLARISPISHAPAPYTMPLSFAQANTK